MQLKFSALLRQRHALDKPASLFLSKMLQDYPYCQPFRMLYVKSIIKENNKHFSGQFNKAMVCAPDRRIFHDYISGDNNAIEAANIRNDNDVLIKETDIPPENEQDGKVINVVDNYDSENQPGFQEEADPDKNGIAGEDESETADLAAKKRYQQQIIDRFIEKDPRIEVKRKDVTQGELSRCSIEDKPDLASETLAEILLKQGKKERAILIYKKLILMFPEKSSYFAKKLENIN